VLEKGSNRAVGKRVELPIGLNPSSSYALLESRVAIKEEKKLGKFRFNSNIDESMLSFRCIYILVRYDQVFFPS